MLFPTSTARAQTPAIDLDINQDGLLDDADHEEFVERYQAEDLSVDFDQDGLLTPLDMEAYVSALQEVLEE